jgi:hypothetical protein
VVYSLFTMDFCSLGHGSISEGVLKGRDPSVYFGLFVVHQYIFIFPQHFIDHFSVSRLES